DELQRRLDATIHRADVVVRWMVALLSAAAIGAAWVAKLEIEVRHMAAEVRELKQDSKNEYLWREELAATLGSLKQSNEELVRRVDELSRRVEESAKEKR